MISSRPSGTTTTLVFSGEGGTGTLDQVDEQNSDGSSKVIQYNDDGSTTTTVKDAAGDISSSMTDYNNGSSNIFTATGPVTADPDATKTTDQSEGQNAPFTNSPLVINLEGTGLVATTGMRDGTMFDLKNDGFAQETGWIGPGSGLLVYDPTGGAVTNGSQLFGTSTSLTGGGYAVDGFQALAALDSNSDGVINSSDTAWSSLRVWVDSNENGVVDAGELETLSAAAIASFSLTTTNTDETDPAGNYHGKTATYTTTSSTTGEVDDVWFQIDPALTQADTTVSLNGTISLLPDLQGYGLVTGLRQEMQIQLNASSSTLEGYVQSFVAATDDATRNTLVDEIIYQWTGVEGVSSGSRGGLFDARSLEALEAFSGTSFIDPYNGTANPGAQSVAILTVAYQQLHAQVLAGLEAQTDLQMLFNGLTPSYDGVNHVTYTDFSVAEAKILSDLSANRATGLTELADFNNALHALDMDMGGNGVDEGYAAFRTALVAQGADVAATFAGGTDDVYGTVGDDVINAWGSNQVITADQGGNDTLIAGGANQTFWGSGGSNLFIGGTGNNEVFYGQDNGVLATGGVVGNRDTFIAGQGTELFREDHRGNVTAYYAAGDGNVSILNYGDLNYGNTLVLDASIAESNIALANSNWRFTITDGTAGDTLTLLGVGTLQFADGTTINLDNTSRLNSLQQATSGSTLTGSNFYDDIYSYNPGTGHVTLADGGGSNTIWLGGTATAANISLSNSGNNLLITDGTTGDQITDKNYGVQTIRFSDGTTMALNATGSTYTLAGGTTATGTGLNDSYSFASGTGTATISDPGGQNTILLGTGLGGVTLYGSGNDLLIKDGVSGDQIDVLGQLSAPVVQDASFCGWRLEQLGERTCVERGFRRYGAQRYGWQRYAVRQYGQSDAER